MQLEVSGLRGLDATPTCTEHYHLGLVVMVFSRRLCYVIFGLVALAWLPALVPSTYLSEHVEGVQDGIG